MQSQGDYVTSVAGLALVGPSGAGQSAIGVSPNSGRSFGQILDCSFGADTSDRAQLAAIWAALTEAPIDKRVIVYTTNREAAVWLCAWLREEEEESHWSVARTTLLDAICAQLARFEDVQLRYVRDVRPDSTLSQAEQLARRACLEAAAFYSPTHAAFSTSYPWTVFTYALCYDYTDTGARAEGGYGIQPSDEPGFGRLLPDVLRPHSLRRAEAMAVLEALRAAPPHRPIVFKTSAITIPSSGTSERPGDDGALVAQIRRELQQKGVPVAFELISPWAAEAGQARSLTLDSLCHVPLTFR